ncbi:elongation factor G [Tenggerimyces flavus]|uniref:GTP-binding protein n=1 Tax=Tenggerimyces flavus TaxID=1708749 RepID=A0ABV7YN64_9ACTN|nr:TetM/TetW/TetO/TetS family tetracycline resistance ribosomal protection protein [Tenggerimyces flavus]MBM7784647.1 ribosomal protection tetracycline resistance protein [Tenggerimyces flavus]
MATMNIGILAHIDAGKTSLTERLLFDTGAINQLGSVDAGTSQTDTNEIERRRGITIRTAVAPFNLGALQVNIIDTPGHPDFIAEVERALSVLDGAVLVVSAVEGVQAQTRVLARTLRRLRLPTLLFVNKIDRMGARSDELLDDLERKLGLPVAAMSSVPGLGTPAAKVERLDTEVTKPDVATGAIVPAFFGSAMTGAGIPDLLSAIEHLLPTASAMTGELRGTVFSVERAPTGGKIAYVRLHAGEIRQRQRVSHQRHDAEGGISHHSGRITALRVIGDPAARALRSGSIGTVRGLTSVRVGDQLGTGPMPDRQAGFDEPRLQTIVHAVDPAQEVRMHQALTALADADPLIQARPADGGGTSVLLYGEVQKEVVAATLADEFGVEVTFSESEPLYVERVVGAGEAFEEMGGGPDRFVATIGLRVAPGEKGTGIRYGLEVELGSLPAAFHRAVEETVRQTLRQGLYGWAVPDCVVMMTRSGYSSAGSTAGDFRSLTPLVLMAALEQAGTRVCEPLDAFECEVPEDVLGVVLSTFAGYGAVVRDTVGDRATWTLTGSVPARNVHELRQRLPGLTHGEGVWISEPSGDRPVSGLPPSRVRTDGNPLNRQEYLRHLAAM